jgi:hypothetical protein
MYGEMRNAYKNLARKLEGRWLGSLSKYKFEAIFEKVIVD